MAAIDKTYYTTEKQYNKAYKRASDHWCLSVIYSYQPAKDWVERVLWNTSPEFDRYLARNCNIKFIQDRLKEQYWYLPTWRVLVKYHDWSFPEVIKEVILNQDIHGFDYIEALKEISYLDPDINCILDDDLEFSQNIVILSIMNVSL